ncbi:MAG TPA: histidine kinase dimerization/phosphoacceptor domain-containing protein, partial [Kofleriaceae bacterium]
MTDNDRIEEPFARASTALAMATVVISSFGWNVIIGAGPRVPLALIGVVFLIASTLGWVWCERRGIGALATLLAALVALALAGLWISQLGVFLIVFPLIGLAVIYGSKWWGIALTVLFLAFAAFVSAHAGGTPIQIYSSSTGFLPGALFVIVLGVIVVRERAAHQQVRRYAAQVEELATTRERNRIARDIHDSVGHYLTVVHVQIEAARATVASDPAASNECLVRAQEFARDGLTELRRSVSILRT